MALSLTSRALHRLLKIARRSPFMPPQNAYNLTIFEQRRFLWFRVAKVGTRSILRALQDADVPLSIEHAMGVYYPVNAYEDYFNFAFVRNPWDRLVSCYHNKVAESEVQPMPGVVRWKKLAREVRDFGEFVDYVSTLDLETCDIHLRLQSRLINLEKLDFLGRFETLGDDFRQVCDRIEIPCVLGQLNRSSNRKPYQEYYDAALRQRVESLYDRDIRIFNYSF